MKWIRGPVWDSVFILSGLPLGIGLLCLTGPWYDWPHPQHYGQSRPLMLVFMLVPLLETGHSLSPIALAWSHRGFRRLMLERKAKFILLPGAVFLAAAGIGAVTSLGLTSYIYKTHHMFLLTDLSNPFPILVWAYMIWNAYHFGMQNFGVLQIYQKKRDELERGAFAGIKPTDGSRIYDPLMRLRRRPDAAMRSSRYARRPSKRGILNQRIVDKLFCLTVTGAAMVTAFPISFLHTSNLRDLCVAMSLIATSGMLCRELQIGFCLPRFVFILTDGLALALIWWLPIIGIAVYSINHWLVAIGLSSHVYSNRRHNLREIRKFNLLISPKIQFGLFALAMLALGSVGFVWLIPTPNGTLLRVIPVIIAARMGLGLDHFLYDWWIWKRWSPIMRDLFPPPPLRLVA